MKDSTSAEGRLPIRTAKDKLRWTRLVNVITKMHKQGLKSSIDIVEVYNKATKRGEPRAPATAYEASKPLRERGKKLSLSEILEKQREIKKKLKEKKK